MKYVYVVKFKGDDQGFPFDTFNDARAFGRSLNMLYTIDKEVEDA